MLNRSENSLRRFGTSFFAVVSLLFLTAASAFAAPKFIMVAPGETFTNGAGFSGLPSDQIAGISFNTTINTIESSTNNYFSSFALVTYTASVSATFNPASGTQSLNQTFGGVIQSGYSPFIVTLTPASTSDCTISVGSTNPTGIAPAVSSSIHVFRMTQFAFTLPGSWTAGQVYYVTVTAKDNAGATVTPYNGSASFRAINGGTNGATTGTLSTVNFVNGVAYPRIQLFYAGSNIQLEALSPTPNPGTITSSVSSAFTVSAGTASKFVIMGPGQTARAGANSGIGRSGTLTSQIAGTPFSVSVYATDDYFNRVVSTAAVALTATDLGFGGSITPSGTVNLAAGVRQFNVILNRVLASGQILTAAGALIQDTDSVTLSHASLATFGFSNVTSPQAAGVGFNLVITAFDSFGNTCTTNGSVPNSVAITVDSGGSQYHTSSFSPYTIVGTQFNGDGNWSGNFYIYRRGVSVKITATDGAAVGSSSLFTVDFSPVTDFYRYILVMPGQTYAPGEDRGSGWGRTGSATQVVAGTSTNVLIYATDLYGNQLISGAYSSVTANLALERTDAGATLPSTAAITNGAGNFNITLTTAYTSPNQQRLGASGGVSIDGDSGYFDVAATSLHHFSVGNINSTQTAGTAFNAIIAARDIYNNVVASFSGPVYITCPNLDYHTPEQSVINVAGGTVNNVTWTVSTGFTNGQWSGNIAVYRAGNPVTIFVASQANGTGNTGTSAAFQVVPGTFTKVFAIVPGVSYRPGVLVGNSLGGYSGTPDAQQMGAAFAITIYATDSWWNPVGSVTGPFHLYTQPNTSSINGTSWNFSSGSRIVSTTFNNADSYKINVDYDISGVQDYWTPYFITSISIDHFKLTGFGNTALPSNLIAGVPFNLSITAWSNSSESMVASTFNGQANLVTSHDYEEPFRVISPQRVTFTNGYWYGQATIYRQVFGGINIQCKLGNVGSSVGINPTVHHNARNRMLAIAPGMNTKPGIAPGVYPPGGFPGYTGNPEIQEAGKAFPMTFYLCDAYYNVVTNSVQGGRHYIRVSSSDPYPANMDGNLPQTVRLTTAAGFPYGAYATSNFKLFTVGTNGYQTVTVEDIDDGSVETFTLGGNGVPPINVKHTDISKFKIEVPGSAQIAGESFSTTVTAQDAYDNTIDNRNEATAFSPTNNVNLTSGSATNTLYPTVVQLPYNGIGYPRLTCYKEYEGVGNSVTASFSDVNGVHSGSSTSFDVRANAFARLIPILPGMSVNTGGGRYTAEPPTQFIGYSGSPNGQTAGVPVNLQIYACDAYGNVTEGATDLVYITSTDRFAPNPVPVRIDWLSGYAAFDASNSYNAFAFHKAAPASITAGNMSNTNILSGTTPNMAVNPAAVYGLVTIAPGQVLLQGSGNTNMASGIGGVVFGGWYSGVTPADPTSGNTNSFSCDPEISGAAFGVTIAATDRFGNIRNDLFDNFELRGNDTDLLASPDISEAISGTLNSGLSWLASTLYTLGQIMIYPWDITNTTLNHATESRSDIQVVSFGQTYFKVWVNGVEQPGPVTVQAAPSNFTVKVEVRDDTSHKVVRTANVNFILDVVTNPGTSAPGTGELNVTYGQTIGGEATITNQSYMYAETIYIRVREQTGATRPTFAYSPEVRVSASGADHIEMSSNVSQNRLEANQSAEVQARVYDVNDNPISGINVDFNLQGTSASSLTTPQQLLTDANGMAYVTFKAGALNEQAIIQAMADSVSGTLTMNVTVTKDGGVYPNPINPLKSNQWAHIDYVLEQSVAAKVYIYTLLGDLVWHKEFAAGTEGGRANMNSIVWNGKNDAGATVANGGYIAVVKVNDQEKYRFKIGVYKEK